MILIAALIWTVYCWLLAWAGFFCLVFLCLSYSSELELHYSPASTNWQQPSAKIATWKSLHWRHKSSVETPRFITYNLRFAPIKTCTLHTQPKQITSSPRWKNYYHLLGNEELPSRQKNMYDTWWKVAILNCKVHIFWEGHKILQNLYLTLVLCSARQK